MLATSIYFCGFMQGTSSDIPRTTHGAPSFRANGQLDVGVVWLVTIDQLIISHHILDGLHQTSG
jgi:hypothetical protein